MIPALTTRTEEEYDLQLQRAEAFKARYARLCLAVNVARADLARLTDAYNALENQARVYELQLQLARPSAVRQAITDEMCVWVQERAAELQDHIRAVAKAEEGR